LTLTPSRRALFCALFISAIGIAALASAAMAQPTGAPNTSLPELLSPWFGLIALAVSLGGTIYAWMTSRSKVNAEHLKTVDTALSEHGKAIQAIEGELKHMPAKDDVTELKISMAEIKGSVAVFSEGMGSLSRTVRRIEEYLMKEGKS